MAAKKKPAVPTAKTKKPVAAPAAATLAASNPSLAPQGKKRVLHIGCGMYKPEKLHANFRNDQWQEVRVDIDPSVKPDIVADMLNMNMMKEGEYEAIWSSHNIEHLHFHEVPVAFKEFFRVLKPGGFMLVTLPDIQTVAAVIAQGKLETKLYDSPAGPIMPLDIVFGFTRAIASGNHFMAHKTAFTAETLAIKLHQAGFCNIQVQRKQYDLWAVAYKLPHGHAMRVDKATISTDGTQKLITQQVEGVQAGKVTGHQDELDRPPVQWKPLGLKKQ